jgi:hypothetical protein
MEADRGVSLHTMMSGLPRTWSVDHLLGDFVSLLSLCGVRRTPSQFPPTPAL